MSLAVTLLADFSARVTAELIYGDTAVAQTEDNHEGEASVDSHFNDLNVTSAKVSFYFFLRIDQSPHTAPSEYKSLRI